MGLLRPVDARQTRHPHRPHTPKPRTPTGGAPTDPSPGNQNALFVEERVIALPGRGSAVAWSPDGSAVALGGHFVDRARGLRYDTRVYDASTGDFQRSFACHHYWVATTAWVDHPLLGPLVVSAGADHAVRLWDATSPGSSRCSSPGQFLASDGGRAILPNVNGWTMAVAFSPDGQYLAAASRDRMVRVWQVAPGPQQWRVVLAWYVHDSGNMLSIAWAGDGKAIFTGDRRGRIARWDIDPVQGRWDNATIEAFAQVGWDELYTWIGDHPAEITRVPAWMDAGHAQVWNVRVSPDGDAVAATGGDGTVSVFAARSGEVRWRHVGRLGSSFHGLDWHPDGTLLAAGSSDGSIILLNAGDGTIADRLVGHTDDVAAVAWSPDGSRLASTAGGPRLSFALVAMVAGPDTTARIWARR